MEGKAMKYTSWAWLTQVITCIAFWVTLLYHSRHPVPPRSHFAPILCLAGTIHSVFRPPFVEVSCGY